MGLFIIIFYVLPGAETADQYFGAPLEGAIIGADEEGGAASSLSIIQPLIPDYMLLTLIELIKKTAMIFSMA